MPFDAQKAFSTLANSDELGGLLKQANARSVALVGESPTSLANLDDLNLQAKHAEKQAVDTANMLRNEVNEKRASRNDKLAILRHMGSVLTRLVD